MMGGRTTDETEAFHALDHRTYSGSPDRPELNTAWPPFNSRCCWSTQQREREGQEAGMIGLWKQGNLCLGRLLAVTTTDRLEEIEHGEPGKNMERSERAWTFLWKAMADGPDRSKAGRKTSMAPRPGGRDDRCRCRKEPRTYPLSLSAESTQATYAHPRDARSVQGSYRKIVLVDGTATMTG
jgi:hypothetical protein